MGRSGRVLSFVRTGLAVGGLLVVAGCFWPVPGQGPDRQAHNGRETAIGPGTVALLEPAWEARVDEGPVGDPVTSTRGVHVNDARSVYGFAVASGVRLWEHGVTAPALRGQVFFVGGRLHANAAVETYPEDLPGRLHGARFEVDPATGAVLAEPAWGRIAGRRGRLQLAYTDAMDFRFDIWYRGISVVDTVTGTASPCCRSGYQDISYTSGMDWAEAPFTLGRGAVLHAGQGVLADLPPDESGAPGGRANGVRAYAIDDDSRCEANPIVACPTWATPLDGTTATAPVLSSDGATAYVGTDAGTVHAVDTATGAVRWSSPAGSAVTDAPALAHGALFVPTAGGDLVVLASDGCGTDICGPLWSTSVGSRITQQPAVAGGVVFTGSADGSLHAFDARGCGATTCTSLWSTSTGSEITGAPAVSQGRVFVGTADGRLVAYALSDR